jgi:competence protein ComEC
MMARIPFVGFVVFHAIGILTGQRMSGNFLLHPELIVAVNLVFAATIFFAYRKRQHRLLSVLVAFFFVGSGIMSTMLQNQQLTFEANSIKSFSYSMYGGTVKTIPEKRKKTLRFEVAVSRVKTDNEWRTIHTKAMVNIPLQAHTVPKAGDFVVVKGNLALPSPPMNPGEFDYQRYLWNKGIVWTAYWQEESFQILPEERSAWSPALWSVRISEWADGQFRNNIQNDRSYGLVKAMLLGRRDDLRSDQIDDYTISGTVHILSVSGMHVMLIFLVISMLFGWLKKLPGGRLLYLSIVVSLLGFYALVTGFPPSVQRATIMCVVLVTADVFRKKHSSVNSLGVSAFIILLLDPLALYDLGFQLSFLAMLGIFLFYKPLEALYTPGNWLLSKTWQVTALSFAAQLATFPISIYYFHQFPFYFWLVNPLVILFTNGLLPAAMLLLAVSLLPFAYLQSAVNWIVEILASGANYSAALPKRLPGYLVENLFLDTFEVIILFVVLFAGWMAYESRDHRWVKITAACSLLLAFYACSSGLQTYLTPTAIIHSVPKHTLFSFREGDKLYLSGDEDFLTDTGAYDFYIKNYAVGQGVREVIFLNDTIATRSQNLYYRSSSGGTLIGVAGKSIYFGEKIQSQAPYDFQVINSSYYPREIAPYVAGRPLFLLGGNVKARATDRWKVIFRENELAFHDLYRDKAILLR